MEAFNAFDWSHSGKISYSNLQVYLNSRASRRQRLCKDFTKTEKAAIRAFSWLKTPTSAFSWLKAPTSAFTFKTL